MKKPIRPGEYEMYEPPNKIKTKVGRMPQRLEPAMALRAQTLLDDLAGEYKDILIGELEDLRAIMNDHEDWDGDVLDEGSNRAIFAIAHRIRGEAAMHDYQVISSIANLLCDFLDHPQMLESAPMPFVKLHVDAMCVARDQNLVGAGGPAGRELVKGFRMARDKLLKK